MKNDTGNCLNLKEFEKKLHNNTETIVLDTMNNILNEPEYKEICTCQQCLKDIASYALNRLPSKYIASPKNDLQTKIAEFENRVNIDAVSVVKKAIKVISENPYHDNI